MNSKNTSKTNSVFDKWCFGWVKAVAVLVTMGMVFSFSEVGDPPPPVMDLNPAGFEYTEVPGADEYVIYDGTPLVANTATPDTTPDFFTISYPGMDSTTLVANSPAIVSEQNCDLRAFNNSGSVTYSISANTFGNKLAVLPTIDAKTGEVKNNGKASPGTYKVTVTFAGTPGCSLNTLVYVPTTPANLTELRGHLFGSSSGIALHGDNGDYNYIDTSEVTGFQGLFTRKNKFNGDISGWDTAKVGDMSGMFSGASKFNQPIGGWDTSKVIDMSFMFNGAKAFNQPIGGWNTSKVEDMSYMFSDTKAFNQPIGGWNTSKVKNMQSMFSDAKAFNQPIGGWKTSKVKNMRGMFYSADSFNQPIGGWNTSRVKNMREMFFLAGAFNKPLSNWDTSQVTDMGWMFNYASAFDQDLSGWNLSKVIANVDYGFMLFYGSAMEDKTSKHPKWKQ